MTLMVSVPIVPSRLLRCLMQGYAAVCIGMGAACLAGWLGPMQWQAGIAVLCMLSGMALLSCARRQSNVRRIDASGLASLALTVQLKGGDLASAQRIAVRLMPGSTLWPGLLVLRLRGPPEDAPRNRFVLVLLPDSVPPGEFRRLVVAVRAVAGRAVVTVEDIAKIL